jgi:hypothetical protein
MIVGQFYDGDWDDRLKWEQHDVYGDALGIIVSVCRNHVKLACALLQAPWPEQWESNFRFDHRTLQDVHDILAAAWRHTASPTQPTLPFDDAPSEAGERVSKWLQWLRVEIESWRKDPHMIALVFTILANQNKEKGYQAEEELAERLYERIPAVPWRRPSARVG